MQVRKTDSVNDRKGKVNQLLIILLTQNPMVWEGHVRDWGHVGWLENSQTCLDASKGRKAQHIVGALIITSPSVAFVCRLHCRIDKTLCGLVKEGWQVFHVSPLLGKDISRSLITTGEQSSLVLLFSRERWIFYFIALSLWGTSVRVPNPSDQYTRLDHKSLSFTRVH